MGYISIPKATIPTIHMFGGVYFGYDHFTHVYGEDFIFREMIHRIFLEKYICLFIFTRDFQVYMPNIQTL